MNIIIKLSERKAQLIYEGGKTLMLLKSFPGSFDIERNYVYICERESSLVTGFFAIDKVLITPCWPIMWCCYHSKLHSLKMFYEEIERYGYMRYVTTGIDRQFCIVHIAWAAPFFNSYSLKDVFGVQGLPRRYAYTYIDWCFNDNLIPVIDVHAKKAIQ